MLLGLWKNFDELESSLSIKELEALIQASRDKEYRHNKFLAALQNIELPEPGAKSFEDVKARATQRLFGVEDIEDLSFEELGINFEEDGELE